MNVMEFQPTWSEACVCGRTFSQPQAYTYHTRSCHKTKKRLAFALEKAKDVWAAKKRRKLECRAAKEALPCHPNIEYNHDTARSDSPAPVETEVAFVFVTTTSYL
jgi:hypothetical protein